MILPSTFIFKGGIEGETSMEHIIDVLKKSNINFFEAGFTQSELSVWKALLRL